MSDFEQFYDLTSRDIYAWCAAHNFTPHWQQKKLLDLVQWESTARSDDRRKRIAVSSGQGPGKTAALAMAAGWRTWRALNALTFITAPTQHQVRDVFLAEYRRWRDRSDPIIKSMTEVTKTRVIFNRSDTWGIWTVPASKPESFAGRHEENMTILVDEATGVEREIMETIQGTLTNDNALLICTSNPTRRDCYFYDLFNKYRAGTWCLRFNTEETPESAWFSLDTAHKLADEYGRESDVYAVRVLGQFPGIDPKSVMSIEDLEICAQVDVAGAVAENPRSKVFGIDLARYGSDESTIYQRCGNAVVRWQKFAKKDPSWVLRKAMNWQRDRGWKNNECWYVVDTAGLGDGAVHTLHEAGRQVYEFKGGSRATDRGMYENKITEAYFEFAKKARKHVISIPNDDQTLVQLSSRQYLFTPKGRLTLEPKEHYAKRMEGQSPDRADGIVMCYYPVETLTGHVSTKQSAWEAAARAAGTNDRRPPKRRRAGINVRS